MSEAMPPLLAHDFTTCIRKKSTFLYKCISLHIHHAQSEVHVPPAPNILGPELETCFMSPFWCLQFGGGSLIAGKFVDPFYTGKYTIVLVTAVWYKSSYFEEALFGS